MDAAFSMQAQLLSRPALFALFLAFTLIWAGGLGSRKLVGPDEGRYAEIAREMALSGDWVTPRLNGIKYFEKPPLQYWATAVAFKTFGENEWSARLWAGGTGLLCVLLTYFTGRRLFDADAGLLAAAVAASTPLFLLIGHLNTLDMGLTFFLHLAVSGFLLAQKEAENARPWMLLTWSALALAVLSKGLVALLLPGATLVVYSLLARDFSPWRRLQLGSGLPLFLLIAAPWFVAVSLANPEFARFFFIHEHFERFLTTSHGRYQPWWYFLPIILVGALPWTLAMLAAMASAWRKTVDSGFQASRFLLVWVLVIFLFFSASDSKLPSYILPMIPALALLTGVSLAQSGRRALLVHAGLAAAMALCAAALPTLILDPNDIEAGYLGRFGQWISAAAVFWFLGALFSLALAWKGHPRKAALLLAGATLVAGLGVVEGHDELGRHSSAQGIARQISLHPDQPFYSVRMYDQTLPFYLGRTVTLVDYRDEMAFGLDQQPGLSLPTLEAFRQHWMADTAPLAIMSRETLGQLQALQLPMAIVAQDTRRIIVRKVYPPPAPRPEGRGDGCSAAQSAASMPLAGPVLGRPCDGATP